MTIEEAVEALNKISMYILWDPKKDPNYFEIVKGKVRFNDYSGVYSGEREFYEFEEIIEAAIEIETIEVLGLGRLRTRSYAFQIIDPINKNALAHKHKSSNLKNLKAVVDGATASIENAPFIHANATISEQLISRVNPLIEYTQVIQIDFKDSKPSNERCNHTINTFLYELEHTYNLIFTPSDFKDPNEYMFPSLSNFPDDSNYDYLNQIAEKISHHPISEYDPGAVSLLLSAKQAHNEEIKLILLYKVFEFFGPIVIKLETHEALGKRLANPQVNIPNSEYLTSIIDLVVKYQKRSNDLGMLKEVFKTCLDIEIISSHLPPSLLKTIGKKTNLPELRLRIAQTLYSTRNSFVHAKSNYDSDGNECKSDELSQFNEFLSLAASQVIKWHQRLPKHQK